MTHTSPRNIRIGEKRTSMRLEPQFWDALAEMADRTNSTIGDICTIVAARTNSANLSSAVRVEVLAYFRTHLASLDRTRRRS
ncbi:MAG: ribbon-helix-helix domain-containing protein [Proteobacteria bacterium]|nr:ribbon-helix-helix domain-containing protein [Pseudomonadota bacterium]